MRPLGRRARLRRLAMAVAALALLAGGAAAWPLVAVVALAASGTLGTAGAVVLARVRRSLARPRTRPASGATVLGRSVDGRTVALDDRQLGAHALLVGASGSGKSTTMLTVLADRIARGHPVVAIDMKGSPAFASTLAAAAAASGRTLRVWTPEGPTQWNPLAHGKPTALKDKLISSERFSEPHYRRAAERYLQTALQVLQATGPAEAVTLGEVVAVMEPAQLAARAEQAPEPLARATQDYLQGLTRDQLSAARGIATRLALLHESDAGHWLGDGPGPAVDLGAALTGGDVVLLSINSSIYGSLGGQLGALAIQDLTSAAGRRLGASASSAGPGLAPATTRMDATIAIDEFSALGADNVLSLLARGREAGVGVLLATQELADLERAGRGFRDQVLGITAVTLAHRQEVHESAVAISRMAGSQTVWRETVNLPAAGWGLRRQPPTAGSRRQHEEPVVHPNLIKRLGTGQLVLLSNVDEPTATPVAVNRPAIARPAASSRRARRRRDRSRGGTHSGTGGIETGTHPPRDQPAPGVTR